MFVEEFGKGRGVIEIEFGHEIDKVEGHGEVGQDRFLTCGSGLNIFTAIISVKSVFIIYENKFSTIFSKVIKVD